MVRGELDEHNRDGEAPLGRGPRALRVHVAHGQPVCAAPLAQRVQLRAGHIPLQAHKPGVKGFPDEHRRLLAEIIDGTGGECGTGTVNGKTYYAPCRNPREWFGKVLKRQAEFLSGLVDDEGRPIPVVIRYLHESDGGWFPWGAPYATAEEFKKVCRAICAYHRRNANGDRLLFAYTPDRFWKPFGTEGDTNNTFLARYPGDEYTDIIGIDDYSIGTGETDQKAAYRKSPRSRKNAARSPAYPKPDA